MSTFEFLAVVYNSCFLDLQILLNMQPHINFQSVFSLMWQQVMSFSESLQLADLFLNGFNKKNATRKHYFYCSCCRECDKPEIIHNRRKV
jgi:hypothetical protein